MREMTSSNSADNMTWDTVCANKFCASVTDGTHDSPKPQKFGKKLITSKHLMGDYIDFDSANWISENDYKKIISRSIVEQWDVLFSMIGTIGNIYIEKNPVVKYACKNMGIFKFAGNKENAYWMYYYLQSPQAKEYFQSHLRGSTQSYVPLCSLREMPVPIPDKKTRNGIVSLLRSLDEKIAINREINDNLQQQAQALFKKWFVDNPDAILWKEGTFSNLIEKTISGDWGKDSPSGNNTEMVYCIRGADIPEVRAGNKGKMPTRYILPKNYAAKQLVDGDIVVEISGGSPTQSTGRAAAVSDALLARYDKGMVCTNFCKALKPRAGYSMYVYYYWQYLYDRDIFFSYENGTTGIKNLDINGFIETEPIVIAPEDLVEKFDAVCQTVFSKIYANGMENEQLALVRDTLLPKLMSGEIDVSAVQL